MSQRLQLHLVPATGTRQNEERLSAISTEPRHFLGFSGASKEELLALLHLGDECFRLFSVGRAEVFRPLDGHVVVLASWIPRDLAQTDYDHKTLKDYEEAATRLGISVLHARPDGSEPLAHAMRSIESSVDSLAVERAAVVVRHPAAGVPYQASRLALRVGCRLSIINGGDGRNEDPAEALSHIQFLRHSTGRVFERSTWLLLGDLASQPAARSLFWGLHCLGATLHLAGPPILVPNTLRSLPRVTIHERLETAPTDLDGVLIASTSSGSLAPEIPFTLDQYLDPGARSFIERLSSSGVKLFECDTESGGTTPRLSFLAAAKMMSRPPLFAISARAATYRFVLEVQTPSS